MYNSIQDINNERNNKRILHPDAATATKNGRLLYRKRNYEKAIVEFKTSLKLRESFIGRYDEYTASIYFFIGNCYFRINDYDNAIVAYRTRIRIRRLLANDDSSNPTQTLDSRTILALQKKGYNSKEISVFDKLLNISIRYEKLGDICRAKGDYLAAIKRYEQAIVAEKKSKVGVQLTVAFLWRKIGFLVGKNDDAASSDNHQQPSETVSNCDDNDSTCSLGSFQKLQSNETKNNNDESFSVLSLVEGAGGKDEETNVFQAMQNLAHESKQEINWQSVVDCIDVKNDTFEMSMPEIRWNNEEEENLFLKVKLRHSCSDFNWTETSCREQTWEKKRLLPPRFTMEKDGNDVKRTKRLSFME